jgi:hypothetical protein
VDPTAGDDSEFTTTGDQGEPYRMDLRTVRLHALGPVLGHGPDGHGVLQQTLAAGVRLVPGADPGHDGESQPAAPPAVGAAVAGRDRVFTRWGAGDSCDWASVAVALQAEEDRGRCRGA